jgi:hypothetical protein
MKKSLIMYSDIVSLTHLCLGNQTVWTPFNGHWSSVKEREKQRKRERVRERERERELGLEMKPNTHNNPLYWQREVSS